MDNELFIRLLEQNNRLIIPEFGAFLKKEQGDSHIIVFTPFLKKDDGVFKNGIQEHFQVDEDEASTIIGEFVNEIRNKLSDSGSYYIDTLGVVKLDANGALSFFYDPKPRQSEVKKPTFEQPVISQTQPSRVVSDQSPMKSMLTDDYQSRPFTPPQPIQSTVSSDQQRTPQPSTIVRPTTQNRAPIPQPAQRIPAPQPRPTGSVAPNPQNRPAPVRPTTGQRPQQPQGTRPAPKKGVSFITAKTDIWLIVAIVAALIVIALIIYGYVNSDPQIPLEPLTEEVTNLIIP